MLKKKNGISESGIQDGHLWDRRLGNQDYYAHALDPVERVLGNIL